MADGPDEPVGFLGEGSRLTQKPSPRLAEAAFARELEAAPWLWRELSLADLAHTRELVASGTIDAETGRALLGALLEAHGIAFEEVGLDPMVGDLYNNRDRYLRERFGSVMGAVHTGRARREATTLAWHLRLRVLLIEVIDAAAAFAGALVQVAGRQETTLMPDFTYLQHAHPTTLAHYLLGYAFPLLRDVERLEQVFAAVNRSPAGSGSVNGSRFPFDRERMARDLEFDGVITHTRDAMWAPDLSIHAVANLLSVMTTTDRLVEELQIWSTNEFGFVELADRHSRTSVIMPQKKNPYGLAMLRGHARSLLGDMTGIAAANLTPSGQPDNRTPSYDRLPKAVQATTASLRLAAEILLEATFDSGAMLEAAASGFSYATDLCDLLVVTSHLDNRTAHEVVGLGVRRAIESGRSDLTAADVRGAAAELDVDLGELDDGLFETNLDPSYLISVRTGLGGAGNVSSMIGSLRDRIAVVRRSFGEHPLREFESRFVAAAAAYKEEL